MAFSKSSRRKKPVARPIDSEDTTDPSVDEMAGITQVLNEWSNGDPKALDRLVPIVSKELREMAGRHMAKESSHHTLQPTALVNEVCVRLLGQRIVSFSNRSHFLGFASELMRRVLVEAARRRLAEMRGKGERPVSIETLGDLPEYENPDLLRIHEALVGLEKVDPRAARVTVRRFFGGLSNEEIAEVEGKSVTTIKRDWRIAKIWLRRELGDPKK